jgi:hypothetical protein
MISKKPFFLSTGSLVVGMLVSSLPLSLAYGTDSRLLMWLCISITLCCSSFTTIGFILYVMRNSEEFFNQNKHLYTKIDAEYKEHSVDSSQNTETPILYENKNYDF